VRRLPLVLLILLFATSLLVGTHSYVAHRLVLDPGVPEPWSGLLIAIIVLLGMSLVAQPFGERLLSPRYARIIAWPASLWMGLIFLILLLLGASDALLWLTGSPALAAPSAEGEGVASVRALVVFGIAFTALAFGVRSALAPPRLKRVRVAIDGWPAALGGYRIVQISDLHIGPILGREFSTKLVAQVNALDADLVALTGDWVDGAVAKLSDEVAPFGDLRARDGVYFVTGNHDHYSGARDWAAKARELGMRVLRNERVEIRRGDAVFDLVGVDDHRGNWIDREQREDLPRALAGRDCSRPAILMAHDPTTFKVASRSGIDLQLSGHTHGGQIWPFRYLVKLAVPYVDGLHREGRSQLYVSRGTGFWGPPVRIGAPAEVTEIEIVAASG
jgi:predicted MPP superfamily phosphohydrolase